MLHSPQILLPPRKRIVAAGGAPAFPSLSQSLNFRIRSQDLAGADSSTVTTWADTSGAGFNLASGSSPILCKTGALDALPYAAFGAGTATPSNDSITQATYSYNNQAFSAFLVVDYADIESTQFQINFGSTTNVIMLNGHGALRMYNAAATSLVPPSGRRVAVLVTLGASAVKIYLDSSTNVGSTSAFASATVTGGFDLGAPLLRAKVYEVAMWSGELSSVDAATLLDVYAAGTYGTGGAVSPAGRVIFDGDSITQGTGSTKNRNWPYLMNPANGWVGHNYAIAGQKWSDLIARQADTNTFANSSNYLFAIAGTNDLGIGRTAVEMEGDFQTYMTGATTGGFVKAHMGAATISAGVAANAERIAYNSWLRSNFSTYAGFLVDLAHDSQLGSSDVDGSPTVPGNWFDGAHYSDAGYTLFAALVRSTIGAVPF